MNDITVLMPVSPIPSHPSTEVIDEVIKSIRDRLPHSEIIIMFDGLSSTTMQYKTQYEQFKQKMLLKINLDLENVVPLIFDKHEHQSGMTRVALNMVTTSTILFVEQDTPLHNDIPFKDLIEPIKSGYCNTIRFHFEASIPPEHEHLMLDKTPINILGVPFLRTRQWSQRPHLSSTHYYKKICKRYWDYKPRFIEHIMYGLIAEGGNNFDEHRLHIYAPEGTLVRSKHLDGRRYGAEQYDPTAS